MRSTSSNIFLHYISENKIALCKCSLTISLIAGGTPPKVILYMFISESIPGVKHADVAAGKISHSNTDQQSEFETYCPEATEKGVIERPRAGKEMAYSVLMANEFKFEPDDDNDKVFDESLCELAEIALNQVDLDDVGCDIQKVRGLMIKIARDINTFADLHDYVSKYSDNSDQIGLGSSNSASTYNKTRNRLRNNSSLDSLRTATQYAVLALFRNGIPIPKPVQNKYNLSYDLGPEASEFPPEARNHEMYSFINRLLEIVGKTLTLQHRVQIS